MECYVHNRRRHYRGKDSFFLILNHSLLMQFGYHLQRINRLFKKDARIDLEHISLYNSLFAWWYHHRNGEKVAICHKRMMRDSGIKSKDIYNKTLIELDQFGYIMLIAPTEKEQACAVRMIILKQEKVETNQESIFFKLPAQEDLSKDKSWNKNGLKEIMLKLVGEILDRVLLLKIHLEKEM
jgi:hypothetical protein